MFQNTFSIVFVFAVALVLSGCGSFEKSCSDGVCKYVENGQVRYEGDPEKIKKIRMAEDKGYAEWMQFNEDVAKTPRKTQRERIRVVVIWGEVDSALKKYHEDYKKMLRMRFKRDRRVTFVHKALVQKALKSNRGDAPEVKKLDREGWVSEIAVFNGGADAVAFVDLKVQPTERKDKTMADFPSFRVAVTSAYEFNTYEKSYLGKSMTSAIPGVTIVGGPPRNIKRDQVAVSKVAKFISRRAQGLRHTMPTQAALTKIHAGRKPASSVPTPRPRVKVVKSTPESSKTKPAPKPVAKPVVQPAKVVKPERPESSSSSAPSDPILRALSEANKANKE